MMFKRSNYLIMPTNLNFTFSKEFNFLKDEYSKSNSVLVPDNGMFEWSRKAMKKIRKKCVDKQTLNLYKYMYKKSI